MAASLTSLPRAGLRAARVTVGFCIMAYDGVAWTVRHPAALMDKVERRGLKVEKRLNRTLGTLEHRSEAALGRVRSGVSGGVQRVRADIQGANSAAEAEIEAQVERALLRLGLPTRDRLEVLTREIELLSAKIDQELALLEKM